MSRDPLIDFKFRDGEHAHRVMALADGIYEAIRGVAPTDALSALLTACVHVARQLPKMSAQKFAVLALAIYSAVDRAQADAGKPNVIELSSAKGPADKV